MMYYLPSDKEFSVGCVNDLGCLSRVSRQGLLVDALLNHGQKCLQRDVVFQDIQVFYHCPHHPRPRDCISVRLGRCGKEGFTVLNNLHLVRHMT
jgi:hypothetical protein